MALVDYSILSRHVTFGDFLKILEKSTAKNTTKSGNIPGLLHVFDILCHSPGMSTVFQAIIIAQCALMRHLMYTNYTPTDCATSFSTY